MLRLVEAVNFLAIWQGNLLTLDLISIITAKGQPYLSKSSPDFSKMWITRHLLLTFIHENAPGNELVLKSRDQFFINNFRKNII